VDVDELGVEVDVDGGDAVHLRHLAGHGDLAVVAGHARGPVRVSHRVILDTGRGYEQKRKVLHTPRG